MQKTAKWLRWSILAGVLLLLTYRSYLHIAEGGYRAASIHGLCPFGGLESLYQFFVNGALIDKVISGTMALFFVTLVLALLFRRSFCGMICPLGLLQEIFGNLGRKLLKKRLVVPPRIDSWLRYGKYAVLVLTGGMAWYTAGLWMTPYDPWVAYAHLP